MSGRIDFTMGFNASSGLEGRYRESHYRIYLLGDFSGRSDIARQRLNISRIDNDSFNRVMTEIRPTVAIDSSIRLDFETLEDFHPDAWINKVGMLADLQVLKRQLNNPLTAARAAEKIQTFLPAESSHHAENSQATMEESQDDMLQRLLGKRPDKVRGESDVLDRLLKEIVSPHVSKTVEPQHQALIQVIDDALKQFARTILHNPAFQRLEALWLATEALLREEAADQHSFFLMDIGRSELTNQINNDCPAFKQGLLQHMQKGDGEQSVVLLGDVCFSDSAEDDQLLAYCADLAAACGGVLLASVDPAFLQRVLGGESVAEPRKLPNAERVLLACPRYLQRLPYGNKLDPIEAFEFEECSQIPQSHELLWGNPAFLLARALLRISQHDAAAESLFFSDVPVFSFEQEGEQCLQPGTESVLTEAQANELFAQGVMPLIGYHQRRGVRLLGIGSLSGPQS